MESLEALLELLTPLARLGRPALAAIDGRCGSGKSTLFGALSGLYRYQGSARLEGTELSRHRRRLTGRMSFFNCFYNSPVFFLFRLIYRIFQVFSENRLIGRDLNNIHTINITELFFLSQGCTGHTTLLIILIK